MSSNLEKIAPEWQSDANINMQGRFTKILTDRSRFLWPRLILIFFPGDAPQLAGVPGRNTAPALTLAEPMAIKLPLVRCRHHQTVSAGSPAMAARAAAPAHGHVTAFVIMEVFHVTAVVHALLGTKAHVAKHVRYWSFLQWVVIIP